MKETYNSAKTIFRSETLLIFVLSLIFASCQAQVETKPIKKDISGVKKFQFFNPKIDPNDVDPYFTENSFLHTDHGPKSITRSILQDKNGIYWFATWNGIMSYDGDMFTNHTNKEGLRRHRVFCILENDNEIWFGTIGAGLYKYDGKEFTNITTADGLGDNEIECMMKDRAGNVWFGTGAGVSIYDGEQFQNYTMEDGLLGADAHDITEDKEGKIWVASTNGICIFNPAAPVSGQNLFTEFKNAEGESFNNVRTIIEDEKGAILFGGNDGLTHFEGSKFTTLTKDFVGYLYEDRHSDIWFNKPGGGSSGEGLYVLRNRPLPLAMSAESIELVHAEDEMVFGIMEDKQGNIWYGRLNGATRYDGKSIDYFK